MVEKYLFSEMDSAALCKFLVPMLVVDRKKRAQARDMIDHEWLNTTLEDDTDSEW
jgi:serine/threonine-protein kinase SRPK3